jgi:hypothetical protein
MVSLQYLIIEANTANFTSDEIVSLVGECNHKTNSFKCILFDKLIDN